MWNLVGVLCDLVQDLDLALGPLAVRFGLLVCLDGDALARGLQWDAADGAKAAAAEALHLAPVKVVVAELARDALA